MERGFKSAKVGAGKTGFNYKWVIQGRSLGGWHLT